MHWLYPRPRKKKPEQPAIWSSKIEEEKKEQKERNRKEEDPESKRRQEIIIPRARAVSKTPRSREYNNNQLDGRREGARKSSEQSRLTIRQR